MRGLSLLVAPLLLFCLLGCDSGPSEPVGPIPCAAEAGDGARLAICSETSCRPFVAVDGRWVNELTGEDGGACLEPGPGEWLL